MSAFDVFADDDRYSEVMTLTLRNPQLAEAFRDLAATNGESSSVSRNCARAIERIRQMLTSPQELPINKQWEQMRSRLNCDEHYLKFVTDASRGTRHGGIPNEPGSLNLEIGRRAWTLMNRFLELRLRKLDELPVADFPMLTG